MLRGATGRSIAATMRPERRDPPHARIVRVADDPERAGAGRHVAEAPPSRGRGRRERRRDRHSLPQPQTTGGRLEPVEALAVGSPNAHRRPRSEAARFQRDAVTAEAVGAVRADDAFGEAPPFAGDEDGVAERGEIVDRADRVDLLGPARARTRGARASRRTRTRAARATRRHEWAPPTSRAAPRRRREDGSMWTSEPPGPTRRRIRPERDHDGHGGEGHGGEGQGREDEPAPAPGCGGRRGDPERRARVVDKRSTGVVPRGRVLRHRPRKHARRPPAAAPAAARLPAAAPPRGARRSWRCRTSPTKGSLAGQHLVEQAPEGVDWSARPSTASPRICSGAT